jgi:hypothetical protein
MRIPNNFRILFFAVLFICSQGSYSQNKKDSGITITPSITFSYLNSNDTLVLTANIFDKKEQGTYGIKNAVIEFSAAGEGESKNIGQTKSDEEGNAIVRIHDIQGFPVDKEGKTTFTARFNGKGKFLPAMESLSAKFGRISVSFSKNDSIRLILVSATQFDQKGAQVPILKEKVIVYVPRLFNLLKIGETDLDEEGKGKVEYPGKLVGDSLGNITVIARIEESDTYGFVQGQSSISWGIPKQFYLAEKPTRELWTPIAPIWMIVTLIIMLTGVWAHYMYAVYQLIMIKRISKKNPES